MDPPLLTHHPCLMSIMFTLFLAQWSHKFLQQDYADQLLLWPYFTLRLTVVIANPLILLDAVFHELHSIFYSKFLGLKIYLAWSKLLAEVISMFLCQPV